MWCCERLVKAPSLRRALLLGLVLAVALLPGHPQFVLFICQLVALRLVVEPVRPIRAPPAAARGSAASLSAFVVMLLLGAVAVPAVAGGGRANRFAAPPFAPRRSHRGHTSRLPRSRARFACTRTVAPFADRSGDHRGGALSRDAARRRAALFYSIAGVLFFALSLGDATPLGRLYHQTPPGQLFRQPLRFLFVTGFCVSVLTGLAIDVLARGSWPAARRRSRALWSDCTSGSAAFAPIDWWLAGGVLAGGLLAARRPAARPIAALAIVGTLALAPVLVPHLDDACVFAADDSPLRAHAARLRAPARAPDAAGSGPPGAAARETPASRTRRRCCSSCAPSPTTSCRSRGAMPST